MVLCRIRLDFTLTIHRWYFLYDKVRKTNNPVFDFLPQNINFYSSIIMENMIHSFFLPLRMLIYMCVYVLLVIVWLTKRGELVLEFLPRLFTTKYLFIHYKLQKKLHSDI